MCDEGSCCRTFCKVLLIVVNIIFFLAGLLMLAFGIAVTAAPNKVISILASFGSNDFDNIKNASEGYFSDVVRAVGIFMIILGAIVFIIAVFGFFGACCESKCMLITYVILLIIIVLAETALIIFGAVFPDKFEQKGKDLFYTYLKDKFRFDYNANANGTLIDPPNNGESDVWGAVQLALECCGVNGADDFNKPQDFNWTRCSGCGANGVPKVPTTCCIRNDTKHVPTKTTDYINLQKCLDTGSEYINTKSCADSAKDTIIKYGKIAIGIAAGIVGLELIMIVLAIILLCLWGERTGKYV